MMLRRFSARVRIERVCKVMQTRRRILKTGLRLGVLSTLGTSGAILMPPSAIAGTGVESDGSHHSMKKEVEMSLEQTVQRLQDRVDITELLHAYCRHADRLDIDNMTSLFTEDCVVAYVPKELG